MNEACFTELFEFVSYHNIWTIDIVSYYLCSDDSANNGTSVHSYSHIKFRKIKYLPNPLYSLNHRQAHINNILGLQHIIPLITVRKAKHNITIPNRIQFINIKLQAKFIKLLKQLPQHLHNSGRRILIRI